jgi:hypothetical protein
MNVYKKLSYEAFLARLYGLPIHDITFCVEYDFWIVRTHIDGGNISSNSLGEFVNLIKCYLNNSFAGIERRLSYHHVMTTIAIING